MRDDVLKNKDKINKALLSVQSSLSGITKDNDGAFAKYATLIKVMNTIQKPLNDAKVLIGHEFDLDAENSIFYVITTLTHESGQFVSNTIGFPMIKKDPHGVAGLSTYGRRYGIMGLLGLAPQDDDGMDAMGGYVSSEQKSQFAEFLSHNSFDGKRAETKKWWDKIKTSHDADNALDKMAKNIESFKINETLDEQMQNSINKENA
tara:strand:+ start:65 stop:679 length:615 start_codon:yes stop_codon:yes gene_type:complete